MITRDTTTGETREWTYSFADRLGIRHITRNHIYEFIVERNPSVSPVLNYTVCPWVDNEIKIPDFN